MDRIGKMQLPRSPWKCRFQEVNPKPIQPSLTNAARDAAQIGSKLAPKAFDSFYRKLKGRKVKCLRCSCLIKAHHFNLHLVTHHKITDPMIHSKVCETLRKRITKEFQIISKYQRIVAAEKKRKPQPSSTPSPWGVLQDKVGAASWVNVVHGGAIETNRRRH